jgi:hypothetical protein
MEAQERLSLAFFFNPAYSAVISPLPATVRSDAPARYRDISWSEFRRRRADGDFADYGSEVQISDYRLAERRPNRVNRVTQTSQKLHRTRRRV